ncbi:MAG: phosphotransferase [Caldilineaceae bacterium]|nr:phosphotransferase [Caldilineaceae bacterium]
MEQQPLMSLLPETKLEAVEKGLQSAFSTTTVERIEPLAGGLSTALVYKIMVKGKAYVLRLIMHIDALSDPIRQFSCMNLAAEAGVAPRVYYSSVEDALSITDFIETTAIAGHFATHNDLLVELAKTIKAIHATPLFPKLVNFLDGVDGFIQEFRNSRMLPESATAEHFRYYAQIQQSYPRHDPDLVSSHNDLNFNNVLFDGVKFWIIDWEAAFQNDRYADLANIANAFVTSDTQEEIYLTAYFGTPPTTYQRSRLFLMQQVSHMFYAMLMMKFAAAQKPAGWAHDDNMDTPTPADFRKQIGEGQLSMATYEGKLLYAKVVLNEALRNMKSPRFAKAIQKMNCED